MKLCLKYSRLFFSGHGLDSPGKHCAIMYVIVFDEVLLLVTFDASFIQSSAHARINDGCK